MAETKDTRSDLDSLETQAARKMADHGMETPEHLHWPDGPEENADLGPAVARARAAAERAARVASGAGDSVDREAWEHVADTIDKGREQPRE